VMMLGLMLVYDESHRPSPAEARRVIRRKRGSYSSSAILTMMCA
jgi:hypothetical protein